MIVYFFVFLFQRKKQEVMKERLKVMFQKQLVAIVGLLIGGTIIIASCRILWELIKYLFITHG